MFRSFSNHSQRDGISFQKLFSIEKVEKMRKMLVFSDH